MSCIKIKKYKTMLLNKNSKQKLYTFGFFIFYILFIYSKNKMFKKNVFFFNFKIIYWFYYRRKTIFQINKENIEKIEIDKNRYLIISLKETNIIFVIYQFLSRCFCVYLFNIFSFFMGTITYFNEFNEFNILYQVYINQVVLS